MGYKLQIIIIIKLIFIRRNSHLIIILKKYPIKKKHTKLTKLKIIEVHI